MSSLLDRRNNCGELCVKKYYVNRHRDVFHQNKTEKILNIKEQDFFHAYFDEKSFALVWQQVLAL